ncbi:MAG: aminotransferase class V-fold PLP-dependent enzyme [Dermabacter sp.]|nr:aminotransferase class V-fold PLP-dependent enzyme [Dermabacter sp.]
MVNARVYLDHAATTSARTAALEAYLEAARTLGNPSSQHASGRRVRGIVDDALAHMAQLLGVPASWLILTSGGTESDNLALRGLSGADRARGGAGRIVGCATDHPAVVDTVRDLGGALAPVHSTGLLDLDALDALVAPDDTHPAAVLVSAALVNNETGIVQDLAAIEERIRPLGAVLHTDAVQAIGHVPLPDMERVPLVSITGHKIGAPVGAGLLVANPSVTLSPVGTGGGQQRGIRSGTLDAAHAAALAVALEETLGAREAEGARVAALSTRLRGVIREAAPDAIFTAEDAPHSPHVVHVCIEGVDQDALLFLLDQRGIDCSAGSACHAGVTQASHVLSAMGMSEARMRGAVRFSLGHTSTDADVDALAEVLPDVLPRARALGALNRSS